MAQTTCTNNDTLLTNIPSNMPLNMPSSNDSTEISKEELKKLLDDKCSSSEFREFIENLNLDGECAFMRIRKFIKKSIFKYLKQYLKKTYHVQIRDYAV